MANKLNAQKQLSYVLNIAEPHTHYIEVTMNLKNIVKDSIDIKMPVWAPGSYLVREFSRNIEQLNASSNNMPLNVIKVSKNTWRIASNNANQISIKYLVYANEISVRTSFVDEEHAAILPSSVFMYVDGLMELPATIEINAPKQWKKITTALDAEKLNPFRLQSPNYDILADSPIEIGNHETFTFKAGEIEHTFAIKGESNGNYPKMIADMQKIVNEEVKIFGEHPCNKYVIIQHNSDVLYGGLEHLNSTSLIYPRLDFEPFDKYIKWAGLFAHEYFHLWNVKRIRPIELGPFNYDQENYTQLLWVMEGVTSYYDDYILRRTNIISQEKFLDIVVDNINSIENKKGNKIQPVSESSYDAWIKYYRPNENTDNSTISYYVKGAVLATLLDVEILANTKGNKNFDNVLQILYSDFYKKKKRGFSNNEFKKVVESVAGTKFDDFWNKYVNGTEKINYNEFFQKIGIKLVNINGITPAINLGITTQTLNGKFTIKNIKNGFCAYECGLNANDELLAIDNFRINTDAEIDLIINRKKIGDNIQVLVSRNGTIKTINVKLAADISVKYRLIRLPNPTPEQQFLCNKWLYD